MTSEQTYTVRLLSLALCLFVLWFHCGDNRMILDSQFRETPFDVIAVTSPPRVVGSPTFAEICVFISDLFTISRSTPSDAAVTNSGWHGETQPGFGGQQRRAFLLSYTCRESRTFSLGPRLFRNILRPNESPVATMRATWKRASSVVGNVFVSNLLDSQKKVAGTRSYRDQARKDHK